MALDQGHAQPPPSDLSKRTLPLVRLDAVPGVGSASWWRIGKSRFPPLHYSSDPGWRFSRRDMPGTLYLGESTAVCFWEVFWDDLATRAPSDRRLDYAQVEERSAWEAVVRGDIQVVDTLDAEGMIEIGAHGGTFSGPYAICQDWAQAMRGHPSKPAGILYESVRQIGAKCLALFQEYEGSHAPAFGAGVRLIDQPDLLTLLAKYGGPPASLKSPPP